MIRKSARSVCQITSVIPPQKDGVGDAAMKFHTLFARRGLESVILTSYDQKESEGVYPVVRVWNARAVFPILGVVRKRGLKRVMLHYPSIRYFRHITLSLLPLLLRLAGVKTILYLHEYAYYSLVGRARILLMAMCAEQVITSDSLNCAALRKSVCAIDATIVSSGSTLLYEAADFKHGDPPAAVSPIRNLYFFGFIRHDKGVKEIIGAFEQHPTLFRSYTLHLVGGMAEVPDAEDALLIEKMRTMPGVEYHGYLDGEALFATLHTADLFVLPYADGVSERRSSFLAAMMLGKPVLTTAPRVPLHGLTDKENVFFAHDGTAASLSAALIAIGEMDPEQIRALGKNAQQWFDENFSDDVTIQKLIDILCKAQ